jgi:K+-sensing histidine kinase KdpD
VNDCLLEGKVSKAQYQNFKELSQLSKEKLTRTFDSFLNYFAISNYMQSSALKSSSLQSMIATQLYLESSRDKLRNIIVKKSFDDDIKNLCVPEKIGQVINQLTHDAVMRSQNGGELKIRLYTKNEDIVFEVEDAPPLDKATPLTSAEIEKSAEGMIHTPILNQLLCQKIIDEYDGSIGVHHENSGDVHFFKIPKKTFYLGEIYH